MSAHNACFKQTTEMPSLQYRNKKTLFSHQPQHEGPLDRSVCQFLSCKYPGRNRNV